MAAKPVNLVMLDNVDDDGDSCVDDGPRCVKLSLPEHMSAYLEQRDIIREVEEVTCEKTLLENITANYVIVKNILSNLCWQDKLVCKQVCSMFHSVVHTLQKEQLAPADFIISLRPIDIRNGVKLLKSNDFYTEPMVAFVFGNSACFGVSHKCEILVPSPCEPACEKEHHLIDVIHQQVIAPKNCMLTVKTCFPTYCGLPNSSTFRYRVTRKSHAVICGVFIPQLPNVQFKVINIKNIDSLKTEFYDEVDKLAQDHIIKGVVVYVNESYLLHSVEDIVFLNYFKDVQPNVPYALGGCIVEDTIVDKSDLNSLINGVNEGVDFVSDNLVTIGMFAVPKIIEDPDSNSNFDMYSLVLDSSVWAKAKIRDTINEFAKKVPHFQHSVVLKLSCVGRDQKHDCERDFIRAAFPNTRLIGCFGNGELGVKHPPCVIPEEPNVKRSRKDSEPQFGIMYSYSSVFVYIGWGKITSQQQVRPEPGYVILL